MFFLLKSERWAPYRDYWFEVYGTKTTTSVFGLLTVLMMPLLFWIARRGENGIQFLFGARKLAKLPTKSSDDEESIHFIESIVTIPQQYQIPSHPKEVKQKLKVLCGIGLSKIYFIVLFGWIYGLDQLRSSGFRCRNLKDGAGFLLSNETKPADYLNATFAEIWEMKEEIAEGVEWFGDPVNGLISDTMLVSLVLAEMRPENNYELTRKFSQAADLIESFNALGFHEVCNVLNPSEIDIHSIHPPWFDSKNASGTFH